MPPETLGTAYGYADCWRAILLMWFRWQGVISTLIDDHLIADDPRVKSPAVIKVVWISTTIIRFNIEHCAFVPPPPFSY